MVGVGRPYSEARSMDDSQVSGGSPCGATTIAGADGAHQPSDNELAMARSQGAHVARIAPRLAA
jgi:NAD(P)H dehydrogenase (quinone)